MLFRKRFLGFKCLLIVSLFVLFSMPAEASWYDFASEEGVPEISELRIGTRDLENLPDILTLSRDDLDGSKLIIRGRAEISEGKIGAVLVSLDGGENWEKASFDSGGAFIFEFVPDLDRDYKLAVKAVATTGKSSDYESDTFPVIVKSERASETVKKAFFHMLRFYMNENQTGFMAFVSDDFEGDLSSLEDAIDDDFRFLDNISIKPVVTRVLTQGEKVELSFTYSRRVESTQTGEVLTDSASSFMTFIRTDDGFKLIAMASPLIFGISNVEEVATTVDNDSVGDQVIIVNPDTGQAEEATQQETVEETVDTVTSGSETVNCDYDFTWAGPQPTGTGQGFNL